MNDGIRMYPGKDGGFAIFEEDSSSFYRAILFAGTLDACLDFIRKKYGGEPLYPVAEAA